MSNKKTFPGIGERFKAVMIDSFVWMGLMILTAYILNAISQDISDIIRIIAMICIIVIYEPLLISLFGATIGHSVAGIKVVNDNESQTRLSFPVAFFRYILKLFLGGISWLSMLGNSKNKTFHDIIVKSVVVFK